MTNNIEAFTQSWRQAVEEAHDLSAVLRHFASEMTFYSPVLFKPINERTYIDKIIGAIAELIPDLHYTNTFSSNDGAAMVFKGHLDGLEIEGIDIFELNEAGHVTQLKVMIRPLSAINALAQAMMEKLATP